MQPSTAALTCAASKRKGEHPGRPVRIDDVARQLTAQALGPSRIVYTGMRPGEKLHEELFGAVKADVRPAHPLISHVAVPALGPMEVSALDAEEPAKLNQRLAALCDQPATPLSPALVSNRSADIPAPPL